MDRTGTVAHNKRIQSTPKNDSADAIRFSFIYK